jgi:tetratricopeptide (TPR) repeat protein
MAAEALKDFRLAERYLQAAADIVRLAMDGGPGMTMLLYHLGHLRVDLEKYEEALGTLTEALPLSRRWDDPIRSGGESALRAIVYLIGRCLQQLGRNVEAIPFFEESVLLEERDCGPNSKAMINPLTFLSFIHTEIGNRAMALESGRKAATIAMKKCRRGAPRREDAVTALGIALQRNGEYAEAGRLERDLLLSTDWQTRIGRLVYDLAAKPLTAVITLLRSDPVAGVEVARRLNDDGRLRVDEDRLALVTALAPSLKHERLYVREDAARLVGQLLAPLRPVLEGLFAARNDSEEEVALAGSEALDAIGFPYQPRGQGES